MVGAAVGPSVDPGKGAALELTLLGPELGAIDGSALGANEGR